MTPEPRAVLGRLLAEVEPNRSTLKEDAVAGLPGAISSVPDGKLDVYGSLFYAGAQTLRAKLPDPAGAERPVVVLRLHGRSSLGATFVTVVDEYADRLHQAGGRLYLSGVDPDMMTMLARTNQINGTSHVRAFPATATLGEATTAASAAAETWLITRQGR